MNELVAKIVVGNLSEDDFTSVTQNYTDLSISLWPYAPILSRFNIVYSGDNMRIKLIRRGEMKAFVTVSAIIGGNREGGYEVSFTSNSPF
jgi:hypothetical protein